MVRSTLALALVAAVAPVAACGRSALEGGFDAPVPAARISAVERSVRDEDRSPRTLRRLVELLDCDDAAVRFAAIDALERLTGETYGYRHDADPTARREAIERWRVHPGLAAPQSGVASHG